ncbi:MAG: redoxin domain-containing protein [Rhodobacteraceae bacterium]|nr:redoxin domain-containing protein [Paracoccaceae bacterium]
MAPDAPPRGPTRRALLAGGVAALALAACKSDKPWNAVDVNGTLPDLAFTLTRAEDGKTVTAADYRGKIVMLFFGYTFCPDVCPLTMANLTEVLHRMGKAADAVQVLFVTVDPNRDTLPVLTAYAASFDPRVAGLRGSDNQLAVLARRYRVTYSVLPPQGSRPYTVVHGPSIYVFDRSGAARLMVPKFYDAKADIAGVTADMERLVAEG